LRRQYNAARGQPGPAHMEGEHVSPIADFIGNTTYDADAVRVMSVAYDTVLKELHDRGQPAIVQEVIAKRIVELAAIGERNPKRLCETVLSELGLVRR
jgi:hypothetical protein